MRIVDVHTHGLGGHSTRTTNPDDILKIAALHGTLGITDIVLAVYSGPIRVMRQDMEAVKEAMKKQRSAASSKFKNENLKFAKIAGIHLEGPFLNPIRAGALDSASFQKPSEKTWKKLIEGFEDIIKIVTIAPELHGALRLIKTLSNMGMIVSLGHSDATHKETEMAFRAGARCITHIFNAMRAFHHREPGIAGFGLMNQEIYIEVIADPFHLNNRTLEFIFRVKNPERILIISDSIKETKVSSKHQTLRDEAGALRGGSMTIVESAKRLIKLGFDKDKVMSCISANAWSYLLRGK